MLPSTFWGTNEPKTPFIIGIAGSVSVGKSTTARLLQTLLSRWPASPEGGSGDPPTVFCCQMLCWRPKG